MAPVDDVEVAPELLELLRLPVLLLLLAASSGAKPVEELVSVPTSVSHADVPTWKSTHPLRPLLHVICRRTRLHASWFASVA